MKDFTFKFNFRVRGDHTHILIRAGRIGCTLGVAGEIVLRNEEFEALKNNNANLIFADQDQIVVTAAG